MDERQNVGEDADECSKQTVRQRFPTAASSLATATFASPFTAFLSTSWASFVEALLAVVLALNPFITRPAPFYHVHGKSKGCLSIHWCEGTNGQSYGHG